MNARPTSKGNRRRWNAFNAGRAIVKPMSTKQRKSMRRLLQVRDGNDCFYCGVPMPPRAASLEHLVDWSKGGTNDADNLVLAHVSCNLRARGLTVEDKMRVRRARIAPGGDE